MRRKTNPLITLAAVIAVVVTAWLTGGSDSKEQNEPKPRTEQTQPTEPKQRAEPQQRTEQKQQQEQPRKETRAQDPELQATLELIERGGPFPHRQDGATFSNRERRLPIKAHGYYREYTVRTPGATNRGARRIVKGQDGDIWYTRDHYKTFVRLD